MGVGVITVQMYRYSQEDLSTTDLGDAVAWPVKRADESGLLREGHKAPREEVLLPSWTPPSRAEVLKRLANEEEYDVLVIGGGATGCGVAMDCATRGLRVALVEREDFASGTSSRSTKLIHGGIRYLAQAFQKSIPPQSVFDVFANLRFDRAYLDVVSADLEERAFMIQSAPFMTRPIPMMIPIYRWWETPMMWVTGKLYDFMAGRSLTVPPSHLIPRSEALYQFPALKRETANGDQLRGALVVYDGQMNDTRMNLHVALTAVQSGAVAANHCSLDSLTFSGESKQEGVASGGARKVNGAVVVDRLTGTKITVRAKQVINATGVFADSVRRMAEPGARSIMLPGPGSHLVLPDYMSPASMGLVWFTADGRVLYLLPWEGSTIAGTTDKPGEVTFEPRASREEVRFILSECNRVLRTPMDESTIRSCWCGLRPLVRDPNADPSDTKAISRDHVVEVLSPSNLLTVAGGKWTTYRKMAQDAVDRALATNPSIRRADCLPCQTANTRLIGADRGGLVCHRDFDKVCISLREHYGMDKDIARHLCHNYGTRALQLADMAVAEPAGRVRSKAAGGNQWFWKRLASQHPQLEAEVIFAARHEYAETAVDVIARRTRFAFLDVKATLAVLPRVLDLMQAEKGWSSSRKEQERAAAVHFLKSMYLPTDDGGTGGSATSDSGSQLQQRLLY